MYVSNITITYLQVNEQHCFRTCCPTLWPTLWLTQRPIPLPTPLPTPWLTPWPTPWLTPLPTPWLTPWLTPRPTPLPTLWLTLLQYYHMIVLTIVIVLITSAGMITHYSLFIIIRYNFRDITKSLD